MHVIAIANQKGGVGKTTTAVNLSACLAQAGQRVLLVDFDHQAKATDHLGVEAPDSETATAWALLGEKQPDVGRVLQHVTPNLWLAPGHIALAEIDLHLQSAVARELRLARVLATLPDRFDCCVIDCAPSVGSATINALAAADRVIITVQTNRFALTGVSRLLQIITDVRETLNPRLGFYGLATLHRRGVNIHRDVLAAFQSFFAATALTTVIHHTAVLAEASARRQTIVDYAPGSSGHQDYQQLTREVLNHVGTTSPQIEA